MSNTEFIPVATLGSEDGATTADFARSRGRWQALPDGWMSASDMRAELMRIARVPEYDNAAGEALLWSMSDWLEVRGAGRAQEFRAVQTPPEPMTPAQIFEAEAARRAELERERFEREEQARTAASAERNKPFFEDRRRVHRELSDEYVGPRFEALEAQLAQALERIAQLELAQRGEPEAVGAVSTSPTPTPTPSEAPEASRLARARRFMFGDMEPAEIERLLEQEEDADE